MRKFQCLLFVFKQSYICYYMICMTAPLTKSFDIVAHIFKLSFPILQLMVCGICFVLLNDEPHRKQSSLKDRTSHKRFLLENSSRFIFLDFYISIFFQYTWAVRNFTNDCGRFSVIKVT